IQFNDQSSDSLINETTNWEWDFDDGSPVNNSQSPQHTFPQNGSYEVCLVASNTEGTDTICHTINISCYALPEADFTFNNTPQPVVFFVDHSSGYPQSWHWDFNDLGTTSTEINPAFTFSTNDTFNVCLIVSNYLGSDTLCQAVEITSYLPPVANFNYQIINDTIVEFQDISTQTPTSWLWDFDFYGETSTDQNPTMVYPLAGDYNVCLTAENPIGTSTAFCQTISIVLWENNNYADNKSVKMYPQPMHEQITIELPKNISNKSHVYLYNLLGERITPKISYQDNSIVLYRNSLPVGFYMIDVREGSGSVFKGKILIE
ncbi:MAG: PKD domain-containing protein, partial [Bacteroidota bacterium]|nr:PKD domain-containing protein [Bacteroidota bacterium]